MATYEIKNGALPISLNNFRSNGNKGNGFAKSSRFVVNIVQAETFLKNAMSLGGIVKQVPDSSVKNDLSFLAEATELPMRGFVSTDIRYYGPNFKVPYQTQYEDLNVTFLCRDKFIEREFFDTWMQYINPLNTYDFNYRNEYTTKIELIQYSDIAREDGTNIDANGNNATYKFSFYEAYPILVAAQPVTWADDNFHRLTVTFTYKWWQRDDVDIKQNAPYDMISGASVKTTGGTVLPLYGNPVGNPIGSIAPTSSAFKPYTGETYDPADPNQNPNAGVVLP